MIPARGDGTDRIDFPGRRAGSIFSCFRATEVCVMYFPRLKDLRNDMDLRQVEVAELLHIRQTVYSLSLIHI